jgi:hypothetical protein
MADIKMPDGWTKVGIANPKWWCEVHEVWISGDFSKCPICENEARWIRDVAKDREEMSRESYRYNRRKHYQRRLTWD